MTAVASTPRAVTRADVMRAADVAELTGLPVSTVYAFARDGRLPSRQRGKHRLFLRWEVEEWLCAPDG
jgi:excisionase family DNA binding protein